MKFTYSTGQRPLDGYTIKRGIGRGGFGEVYYAVSDGGKEVALKLVRGNEDVELRGIGQCLNLKHTNLVSLYDLKADGQGDHWVVMEFIGGEPLSVVLTRHVRGLPSELAQQWFLALAKAVGHLHDHGIVHRDLKPGNIFVENGLLKVGDYGLSKFISSSQRHAQTQSVGTVYYMAPEVSTGNYNKQIDIYAAGIILYEMLTGKVPFDGESAGEILMKHLTAPPDLAKVPSEYKAIVGKALAKNPAHRYQTMAEFAKAVQAVGIAFDDRRGDAGARRHGDDARVPPPPYARVSPPPRLPVARPAPVRAEAIPTALPVIPLRAQVAELSGSLALSTVLAGLFSILWMALFKFPEATSFGLLFFPTVAVSWAVLIPAKYWNGHRGDAWARRFVMMILGGAVGVSMLWLNGWGPELASPEAGVAIAGDGPLSHLFPSGHEGLSVAASYLSYFGLAMCALRWWKMADRRRSHRFSFFPVLAAGFWSLVLMFIWPWSQPWYGALALLTSAVIVQWVSPWDQPPIPAVRRMRLRYA
ncbi:MAG TPA: serine/threonine-protein kinase [Gemmataceae bacterium]|nr:serine/threonine-protein kinase [Gemmataceae bacterium]